MTKSARAGATGTQLTSIRGLIALLAALALIAMFSGSALVTATHVEPSATMGNPTCEAGQCEFKVGEPSDDATLPSDTGGDGVEVVTYTDVCGDCDLTVTYYFDDSGDLVSFDWESDCVVEVVIVKGGTGSAANVYDYGAGASEDTGLQTPTGQEISHITFCFPAEQPTPTPVEETPTPTPVEETPTPTPTDEPTPTPTLPDTVATPGGDGGPTGGTSSTLTIALLVGALAAAWLLLRPHSLARLRARKR